MSFPGQYESDLDKAFHLHKDRNIFPIMLVTHSSHTKTLYSMQKVFTGPRGREIGLKPSLIDTFSLLKILLLDILVSTYRR